MPADTIHSRQSPNGKHKLTPVHEGWAFTPESLEIIVNGNDYTADPIIGSLAKIYSISGFVRDSSNSGIPGVTVKIDGGGYTVTGSDGSYILASLQQGSYTITASLDEWIFNPESITVQIKNANILNQNFTGTFQEIKGFSIKGRIVDKNGEGVVGVNVSLNGSMNAITLDKGYYAFLIFKGGDYTVTPSLSGWTFTPEKITVTVSEEDINNVDFVGTNISNVHTIGGTVKSQDGNSDCGRDNQSFGRSININRTGWLLFIHRSNQWHLYGYTFL